MSRTGVAAAVCASALAVGIATAVARSRSSDETAPANDSGRPASVSDAQRARVRSLNLIPGHKETGAASAVAARLYVAANIDGHHALTMQDADALTARDSPGDMALAGVVELSLRGTGRRELAPRSFTAWAVPALTSHGGGTTVSVDQVAALFDRAKSESHSAQL